jgi:hypothetical protein
MTSWLQCLHTKGRVDMFNAQLAADIKVISFLHERDFFPDDNGAWERIKKSLEGVQTQTTNSSSHEMPSFARVSKGIKFPTVNAQYCAECVYNNIARHFGH